MVDIPDYDNEIPEKLPEQPESIESVCTDIMALNKSIGFPPPGVDSTFLGSLKTLPWDECVEHCEAFALAVNSRIDRNTEYGRHGELIQLGHMLTLVFVYLQYEDIDGASEEIECAAHVAHGIVNNDQIVFSGKEGMTKVQLNGKVLKLRVSISKL